MVQRDGAEDGRSQITAGNRECLSRAKTRDRVLAHISRSRSGRGWKCILARGVARPQTKNSRPGVLDVLIGAEYVLMVAEQGYEQ